MPATKAELESRVVSLEKELEGMREAVRSFNSQLQSVLAIMSDLRTDVVDLRQFCDAAKLKLWPPAAPPPKNQPKEGGQVTRY